MSSLMLRLILAAQLLALTSAAPGQNHRKERGDKDGCFERAGDDHEKCELLAQEGHCEWHAAQKICISSQGSLGDRSEKGPRRHEQEEDECFTLAGQDEEHCKAIAVAGQCSWSAEKGACYSTENHSKKRWHHGKGGKHFANKDLCNITAGANETACKKLSNKCIWSVEEKGCYAAGSNGTHIWSEGSDICFEHGGHDEEKCNILMVTGHCAWSTEKLLCHSVRRHGKVYVEGINGTHFHREDPCIIAAGDNETMCRTLLGNCSWYAEKGVCYSAGYHGRKPWHHRKGGKHFANKDLCNITAGANETACKKLSNKCTWSVEEKRCYTDVSNGTHDWWEGSDMCFEHGGHDEQKCNILMVTGHCAWSTEKLLCHSVWRHRKGYAGSFNGTHFGWHFHREDPCIIAAGDNETMCRTLLRNCSWSAEKKLCFANFSSAGREWESEHWDICFHRAGPDANKCEQMAEKGCAWSADRNACYATEKHGKDWAVGATVAFTFRLNNIQYSLLAASPSVKSELVSKLQIVIATEAGEFVSPDDVVVDLKPGSVIVAVSINAPSEVSANTVQSNLAQSPQMLDDIVAEVNQIPDIQAVTTGAITATIIDAPVVQNAVESEAAPSPPKDSKLSFIVGSVCGGGAILLFVSLCCCLCRKCRQSSGKDAKAKSIEAGTINLDV